MNWLFDNAILPPTLRELAKCIREDADDGAHVGNRSKADAEDLLDFTMVLLDRLITEPKRLELANASYSSADTVTLRRQPGENNQVYHVVRAAPPTPLLRNGVNFPEIHLMPQFLPRVADAEPRGVQTTFTLGRVKRPLDAPCGLTRPSITFRLGSREHPVMGD